MAAKTIDNCTVIKNAVKRGIGKPEQYYNLNKCLGYARGEDDDEPCNACKKCKFYISLDSD